MIRDQRSQGRHAILSEIRKLDSLARVDIARRTGLSQATVTAITAELLSAGLIEESPVTAAPGDTRRGRPRVGLQLRAGAYLVAGVKVGDRVVSAAIIDFVGNCIAEASAPLTSRVMDGPALSRAIADIVTKAAAKADKTMQDISGLGVGLVGIVDAQEGLVRWSPVLTQRDTPLRDDLIRETGIPAFIDNDANLVAMAELYFGQGRGVEDFLVVTLESGIGLGIVLGGHIYRGTRGCGAEFGHTKVQIDGAMCRCGQRGCLEAYVGDYALLREASLRPGYGPDQDLVTLLEQARAGEPVARNIVEKSGRIFAMGLANLVNIFDPQLIILTGQMAQLDYLYADEVIAAIAEQTVHGVAPSEVTVHRWDALMWSRGAAAFAIEALSSKALDTLSDHAE